MRLRLMYLTGSLSLKYNENPYRIPCWRTEDYSHVFSRVVGGVFDVHIAIASIVWVVECKIPRQEAVWVCEAGVNAIWKWIRLLHVVNRMYLKNLRKKYTTLVRKPMQKAVRDSKYDMLNIEYWISYLKFRSRTLTYNFKIYIIQIHVVTTWYI